MILSFRRKVKVLASVFVFVVLSALLWVGQLNNSLPSENNKFLAYKLCKKYAHGCGIPESWCDLKRIQVAKLDRVVDGDTIVVYIGRSRFKVRYIGVDTPELHPVECFAKQAREFNRQLLRRAKYVYLVKDVRDTDKYGRLLRYVFTDSDFINLKLVQKGYAKVLTIPPDVTFASCFLRYQKQAREEGKGLWGPECGAWGKIGKKSISPHAQK